MCAYESAVYICISYNTPLSALAGIRARIPPEHDNGVLWGVMIDL